MGLSRRKFTKEMKLAAVQQMETGSSAAAVARAFEVKPKSAAPLAEGISPRSPQCFSRRGKATLG